MARQIGLIKIKGKLDDLSFYKSKDGKMVKQKSGVDGDRIKNDPAFARTRENNREFGASGTASKLLRTAMFALLQNVSDSRLNSRLTATMSLIKNEDSVNDRGSRNVGSALVATPGSKELLKNFNFNDSAILNQILFQKYTVQQATGDITINGLQTIDHMRYPKGATHVNLKSAVVEIDFNSGQYDVVESPVTSLTIDKAVNNVQLTPSAAPSMQTGLKLYVLQVVFLQEINNKLYLLNNGTSTSMAIVDVA